MLVQLKLAEKFNDVRGNFFGEMRDCLQHAIKLQTAGSRIAHRGRLENSSCLWHTLGPRHPPGIINFADRSAF